MQGVFDLVSEVKEWEQVWQTTLQVNPNGMIVIGKDLKLKFVNKAAEELFFG